QHADFSWSHQYGRERLYHSRARRSDECARRVCGGRLRRSHLSAGGHGRWHGLRRRHGRRTLLGSAQQLTPFRSQDETNLKTAPAFSPSPPLEERDGERRSSVSSWMQLGLSKGSKGVMG